MIGSNEIFYSGIFMCLLFVKIDCLEIDTENKINAFAEKLLTCRDIVGMNLAIVKDDDIFRNGYGVRDLEKPDSVTPKTIFGIASLTKAFTATLLGVVLKEHGYSWSSKVREVLEEDFYFFDGLRTSQTTMRDLAAHNLGILNHNMARFEGLSREDAAYKLRFFEPHATFRGSHVYNNAVYGLMAYITEKLSGKTWEDTMADYIFRPLRMESATFTHFINQTMADIATAYRTDSSSGEKRSVPLSFHSFWGTSGGSGSIMADADDMIQWLKLQLGRMDGEGVLPRDVILETWEAVNNLPQTSSYDLYTRPNIPVTYAQTGYGLGWRLGWYRGFKMLLHTGTSWGYGALLTLLPDVNIGIYSSITGEDGGYVGRRLLHMYTMDLLLGEEPWLNLTTSCTFPEPWMPSSRIRKQPNETKPQMRTPLDFQTYVGTYGNFQYGNITFEKNKTTVDLMLKYGEVGRWSLVPKDNAREFSGRGFDHIWVVNLNSIEFSQLDKGVYQKVTIDFEKSAPSIFERGLQMSDAPPPPDPNKCGTYSKKPVNEAITTKGHKMHCTIILLLLLVVSYL